MNKFVLNKVNIDAKRISYDYSIFGDWEKYFNLDEKFYVEYSHDITGVSTDVAAIPLLVNVLPIAWVFDAKVHVKALDEDFYYATDELRAAYQNLYPELDFKGELIVDNIMKNENEEDAVALLFSGGVDAFSSLVTNIDKEPTLVTIWGADVHDENVEAWEIVRTHTENVAKHLDLDAIFIRTNMQTFIDEYALSQYTLNIVGDAWWHGFQHSVAMLGLFAPLACKHDFANLFIAATVTAETFEERETKLVSIPQIDNQVKYCGLESIHDGFEDTRQDKIEKIVDISEKINKDIYLRVCWVSDDGKNCSQCAKCERTILGLVAEGADPNDYGFDIEESDFEDIMYDLKHRYFVREDYFKLIQERMLENYEQLELNDSLEWFINADLDQINNSILKKLRRFKYRFRDRVKNVIN